MDYDRGSGRGFRGRGHRGSRGGRGGGNGGRGRGNGHRGGGWGKWNLGGQQGTDSATPGTSGVSRPAEEIIDHWSNAGAPLLPPAPPLELVPPQTNFNLEALKFMQDLRNERELLTDKAGKPIFDCRGAHGLDRMCQFCDGRRGPWVQPKVNDDKGFKRYQETIINSGLEYFLAKEAREKEARERAYAGEEDETESSTSGIGEQDERNVLKLAPPDNEYDFGEEDFGVADGVLSVFKPDVPK